MNGFEILADSYRQLIETNQIDKEDAKSYIKVYDFLSTCSDKEKEILFTSSAFNDMIKELINKLNLEDALKQNIINQLYNIWNK